MLGFDGKERFAFVESWALGSTLVLVNKAHVVEAHKVKNGGMKIVDMEFIFDGTKAEFIGCANGLAAFDPATRHPHGETRGVVVSAIAFFAHGGSAEFASPNDECAIEKPASF